MKNLLLRSFTGIIYIGVIVAGILLGGWYLLAMCLLLGILGLSEFYGLSHKGSAYHPISLLLLDLLGACIMIFCSFDLCKQLYIHNANITITDVMMSALPYACYMIARFIFQLYSREANPLNSLAYTIMGQLYIAVPFALLPLLYYYTSLHLVLAMFILIWLNDTGAFIVGCSIGRHRLFPRISPKKSWEGFFGGMAFCIGAAFVFHYAFPQYFGSFEIIDLVGLSIIVSAFATWGDLIESLIKRTVNVKDSGNLLPGHGGMLDRIDSLLCVIPTTLCYALIALI
ncbi:MAG: phosphatidate cytidylyltransferase [Muribaculaceae bacterium]|nr:phosphatidate cytidylyltransferase [Muribaculaceae bacterium]